VGPGRDGRPGLRTKQAPESESGDGVTVHGHRVRCQTEGNVTAAADTVLRLRESPWTPSQNDSEGQWRRLDGQCRELEREIGHACQGSCPRAIMMNAVRLRAKLMEPQATEDSEIVYHHDVRVVAAMSLLMKMTCQWTRTRGVNWWVGGNLLPTERHAHKTTRTLAGIGGLAIKTGKKVQEV
jgi:hypothetical protein